MQPQVISEEYGIPTEQAREIIGRETRRALLRRWQPWAWLALAVSIPLLLYVMQPGNGMAALLIAGAALLVWYQVGRFLAEPAVHAAARMRSTA